MSTNSNTIVVMHGDQTGEELLKEVLRVLVPDVIGFKLDFEHSKCPQILAHDIH